MSKEFTDPFATLAANYAAFRPSYPAALYAWLAGIAPSREVAWDCGCGNGQAALGLAGYFARVIATDASTAQIDAAPAHPKVHFRVAPAERSGLADASADLITVAQALQWFDLDRFYAETRRVLKPGGVLAAWTYNSSTIEGEEINTILQTFNRDIIGPYSPPERRHVDSGYRELAFPFEEIEAPVFNMETSRTLAELAGYSRSALTTKRFIAARGFDPVTNLERQLSPLWGGAARRRTMTATLSLRVGRV